MNPKILFKNAILVNESKAFEADLLVHQDRITRIDRDISDAHATIVDCEGRILMPGIIDDQVHFREPGLTHKADIYTESRAAVAGGVTSFMEMPNTKPSAITKDLLDDKYIIAQKSSIANYSFFMGTSNDNYDEIMSINYQDVCGLKIFMGSSTGNMLVDDQHTLERIFSNFPYLIATHCEDEATIKHNAELMENDPSVSAMHHPIIRSREACYLSSSFAVRLARKNGTRLHVLHISTKEELDLFDASMPLVDKKITAEACVHHLFFNDSNYRLQGNKIKCNPAIKSAEDQLAIAKALEDHRIDIVATDHAPHTLDEKNQTYRDAPSGLPLVQHSLSMMHTMAQNYNWSMPFIVEKMCHNPAIGFHIAERGFLREGYFADLVVFDPTVITQVTNSELLYKCKWSPLENQFLNGKVMQTYVNGTCVYSDNRINEKKSAMRLRFDRR